MYMKNFRQSRLNDRGEENNEININANYEKIS